MHRSCVRCSPILLNAKIKILLKRIYVNIDIEIKSLKCLSKYTNLKIRYFTKPGDIFFQMHRKVSSFVGLFENTDDIYVMVPLST